MGSIKISDKAKVLIVLAIALFEIAFINFNKDKPRIQEAQASDIVVVQGVEEREAAEVTEVKEAIDGTEAIEIKDNVLLEQTEKPEDLAIDMTETVDEAIEETPIVVAVDEALQKSLSTSDKTLSVHYMDVGQGDAAYIGYGDFDMVIDGGTNEDGPYVVDYLKDKVSGPIEIVVGSHAHEDHIGGLDDVMEAYPIKMVIDSGEVKDTRTYEDYMAAAKKSGAVVVEDATRRYDIDEFFRVDIIEAVDGDENTNNNSVVVKITYRDVSFLFTGDMEEDVESSILTKGIKASVFKAGHHGSSTSNSDMFLRRIQPEIIVISAGAGNKYGHPHADALSRMKKHTDQIFGTWENGTIVVKTDGVHLQIDATETVTMEDASASASGKASESDTYKVNNKSNDSDWLKKLIKPSKKQTKKTIEDAVTEAVTDAVIDAVIEEADAQIENAKEEKVETNTSSEVIIIDLGE